MSKRGRPGEGTGLVEKLASSELAKERLKVILQTLHGDLTVQQACQLLGIRRSAFNKLRNQFLKDAGGLLEPRQAGRKKRVPSAADLEVERLRRENAELRLDLKAQQIREEIAVVMPHLLKRGPGGVHSAQRKKGAPTTRRRPTRNGSGSLPR